MSVSYCYGLQSIPQQLQRHIAQHKHAEENFEHQRRFALVKHCYKEYCDRKSGHSHCLKAKHRHEIRTAYHHKHYQQQSVSAAVEEVVFGIVAENQRTCNEELHGIGGKADDTVVSDCVQASIIDFCLNKIFERLQRSLYQIIHCNIEKCRGYKA